MFSSDTACGNGWTPTERERSLFSNNRTARGNGLVRRSFRPTAALCLALCAAVIFLPAVQAGPFFEPVRLGDQDTFLVKDFTKSSDIDNDGITDHEDLDLDNDGILDYRDMNYHILYEESDNSVTFDGVWSRDIYPYFSGGTARSSNTPGDLCRFSFNGEYVEWIGSAGPGMGAANIYIDNKFQRSIDLYRESYTINDVLYRSQQLNPGTHALRIEVIQRIGEALVYPVEIDAFKVQTEAPTRRDSYRVITGECARISMYAYFFVDWDQDVDDDDLDKLVEAFDRTIFPTITGRFGPVPTSGIDSIEKLYIVLTDIKDGYDGVSVVEYIPGYFSRIDQYLPRTWQFSNGKDILFIDVDPTSFSGDEVAQSLSRQLHHMVHWFSRNDGDPDGSYDDFWVRNGLGLLAGYLCGLGHPYHMEFFRRYPDSELIVEDEVYSTESNEGAAYLFFLYLWEQQGDDFIKAMTASQETGLDEVLEVLTTFNLTFKGVFNDWVMANYLDDPTVNNWGYRYVDLRVEPTAEHADFALGETSGVVPLTAAHYIQLTGVDRKDLQFDFAGNTVNDFQIRAVQMKVDGNLTVEELVLGSTQKIHYDLGGFANSYRSVMLVVSNQAPYEEDGLPWGDGVYSYLVEEFGPIVTGFFNPVFPNMLVVNVEARPTPVVKAYQTGREHPRYIDVNSLGSFMYSAFYHIQPEYPGPGKIIVTGSGDDGRFGGARLDFITGRITSGHQTQLAWGHSKLTLAAGSLPDGTSVTVVSSGVPTRTEELVPVSCQFDISPASTDLVYPARLIVSGLPEKMESGCTVQKLGIYQKTEQRWVFRSPVQRGSEGTFSGNVHCLGLFALLEDTVSPKIQVLEINRDENEIVIRAAVTDKGSGVPDGNLDATLPNGLQADITAYANGEVEAVFPAQAVGKNVAVSIAASDRAGNTTVEQLQVSTPAAGISIKIFPNPADEEIWIRCALSDTDWNDDAEAFVYDVSGERVAQIEAVEFSETVPDVISASWNLVNSRGKPVANGTYFCKVHLGTTQGNLEASGTFAVLR